MPAQSFVFWKVAVGTKATRRTTQCSGVGSSKLAAWAAQNLCRGQPKTYGVGRPKALTLSEPQYFVRREAAYQSTKWQDILEIRPMTQWAAPSKYIESRLARIMRSIDILNFRVATCERQGCGPGTEIPVSSYLIFLTPAPEQFGPKTSYLYNLLAPQDISV